MTGVRELLDAVSTGQPPTSVSVDFLVRSGRRRQKAWASTVAAGTAAVVVAVVVSAGRLHAGDQTDTGGSLPSIGASPAVGTVPLPAASPYDGPRVVLGAAGALSTITSAYLLDGDHTIQTYVDGPPCTTTSPSLTVVDETTSEVRLQLSLTGGPAQVPSTGCGTNAPTPQDGSAEASGQQEERVTLKAPLGKRRLVDATTDATIPYVSSLDALSPSYLPAGFRTEEAIAPFGDGWGIEYARHNGKAVEFLDFNQSPGPDGLALGSVTTTVAGQPASLSTLGSTIDLRWRSAGGVVFELRYISCATTASRSVTPGPCLTPGAVQITQAELLKVAVSVPRS